MSATTTKTMLVDLNAAGDEDVERIIRDHFSQPPQERSRTQLFMRLSQLVKALKAESVQFAERLDKEAHSREAVLVERDEAIGLLLMLADPEVFPSDDALVEVKKYLRRMGYEALEA